MKKITITDSVTITDITLGAGVLNSPDKDELLDRYVALGGNSFDTARVYEDGRSDVLLGQWIKSRRNRQTIVLCTKGCHPKDPQVMHISRLTPADIRGDLETSLTAIGTDYADLYLLHRDNPRIPVEAIMPALHQLVTEGKALTIGASNWTAGRINEANQFAVKNGLTPFSVSQMHFSLAQTTPALTTDVTHVTMNDIEYGWYLENKFPVMAFSAQAKGFFSQVAKGLPLKELPHKYYGFLPENYHRAERLIKLAAELGTNPSALALAYVRDNPLRTSALCAFSSMAQFEESMDVLRFNLTREQITYLEKGTMWC
jgi:aryl-alcohol dehydrogenase-like predicted oxidoreductase